MPPFDHLRLAGVTRLSLHGRGPRDAYVFDPHRLALPCWALALEGRPPALLLTLDRHFDLVAPTAPLPEGRDVGSVDRFARECLDVRNVDHVLAAMELGVLADAVVWARSHPRGSIGAQESWTDRTGKRHELALAASVERGREQPHVLDLLARHEDVVLDIDLDCFTSLSDADPSVVLPWPRHAIRDYLLPAGAEPFWEQVLAKTRCLTLAREPYHVGGLVAGARLFEDAAHVIFEELLRADVP